MRKGGSHASKIGKTKKGSGSRPSSEAVREDEGAQGSVPEYVENEHIPTPPLRQEKEINQGVKVGTAWLIAFGIAMVALTAILISYIL